MKNNKTFSKEQIALFISIALHVISEILLYPNINLPKIISIFITILWAIVDLVLIYRVVASLSRSKTK